MPAAVKGGRLRPVSDEDRGSAIKRRRLALGMEVQELADLADVGREAVTRAEKNEKTSEVRYAVLENALTRREEEIGGPPELPDHTVEFELEGNFGVRVRVKGPVDDLPALERSVARLIRQMGQSSEE